MIHGFAVLDTEGKVFPRCTIGKAGGIAMASSKDKATEQKQQPDGKIPIGLLLFYRGLGVDQRQPIALRLQLALLGCFRIRPIGQLAAPIGLASWIGQY